ncbi:prevent-host-death family protein [mine drainage metagenome]|uniref:Prevent-host-death family protein n=1 Tax=mine drainage metagenome TaxID=410659 RepID=T0ZWI6_9ZZZZ
MGDVSIRELRNHGGDVIDRVVRGEVITITRSGKHVAELKPLQSVSLSAETAISRRRLLPVVNHVSLRADLDQILDSSI